MVRNNENGMLFTNANYCVEKTNHKYPHHVESRVNDLPHLQDPR